MKKETCDGCGHKFASEELKVSVERVSEGYVLPNGEVFIEIHEVELHFCCECQA